MLSNLVAGVVGMVTRLSLLPVCTAATATIVNGASRLHNSVSVVQR